MTVEPYAARQCPELPASIGRQMADLVTAVNGMIYAGGNLDTLVYAVRWLRANPETARKILETS